MVAKSATTDIAAKGTKAGTAQTRVGFTLVELIVVVVIIMLLMALLLPSISYAVGKAIKVETQTRIDNLANAIDGYKLKTGFYPGQRDIATWAGKYTGSQILAACVLDYKYKYIEDKPFVFDDTHPDFPHCYPHTAWATYEEGKSLATINGEPNTLSDGFWINPKAICYYVSRPGQSGLSQFHYDDNSVYTGGGANRRAFEKFITREAFGQVRPYNDRTYLLIGAGANWKYFEYGDPSNLAKNE